ncbi:hypothetical protein GUITHDRAFT_137259 [Guillardia theta CCMP2712]|uniref:protein O-GlcNAc transferase n=1 Tax=Guillardia theta (strain CCMP2712) TaxID=905079 RepID=L1JIH4_GUITC|nr:hypothetical protein GUITHDRAFT_137259 [Guillardia theta CCMP2712]EKX47895.1 hypothetical protein GUITHDRAFT_137259 [Guillardia theta CCMP2712]|eukprot:XP_005834875.1 hypothetical protein GUITHDRAFT_137259 [Guillardia theta CCMP2712]
MLKCAIAERKSDWEQAVRCYEEALKEHRTAALPFLAQAYSMLERYEDAARYYKAALAEGPQNAQVWVKYALVLRKLNRYKEALNIYKELMEQQKEDMSLLLAYARTLLEARKLEGAEKSFKKVLTLCGAHKLPSSQPQVSAGRSQALKMHRWGAVVDPHRAQILGALGRAEKELGNFPAAGRYYREALELGSFPGGEQLLSNAFASVLLRLRELCKWEEFEELFEWMMKVLIPHQLQPQQEGRKTRWWGNLSSLTPWEAQVYDVNPRVQLEVSRNHADHVARSCRLLLPELVVTLSKRQDRRITIGYMSSDFGAHTVCQSMQTLLASHSTRKFHIVAIMTTKSDGSQCRRRVEAAVENVIHGVEPVTGRSSSSQELAESISSAQIMILLDLNGHTKGARADVLALRPAPLQLLFRSYAGTSGACWIDLYLSDKVVVPPEHSMMMSEKLVVLPHTFLATDHAHMFPHPPLGNPEKFEQQPREEAEEEGINTSTCGHRPILASFNRMLKIDRSTWSLWMRALLSDDDSALWLLKHGKANPYENDKIHVV